MSNPLALIAPALLRVLGEDATYTSDSTGLTATLRVIVNRNAQTQLPDFTGARVLERRITVQCQRAHLPAELRPSDRFVLDASGEILVVKRVDADDGNTDLLTCSVKILTD